MADMKPGTPAIWPQLNLARHGITERSMAWHYSGAPVLAALGAEAVTGGFGSITPYRAGGKRRRCDQAISRLLGIRSVWAVEVLYASRGPWPGGAVPAEERRGAEFAVIAASLPPSTGVICSASLSFSRNDAVMQTPIAPPWLLQPDDANPVHTITGLQGHAPATSDPALPAYTFSLTTTEMERQLTLTFVLQADPVAATATSVLETALALAARIIPSLGGKSRA